MSRFNLKEACVAGSECVTDQHKRQTASFVIESEVFGSNGDKEKIVELILSTNENMGTLGNVSVIPIVGLGGLGETTLAQLAYNDERVAGSFELKLWVSVNEVFDWQNIMRMIIEAATRKSCEFMGMDVLQYQLRDFLRMRKCLLVLDDVWNEDQDEWEKLRMLLYDCAATSKSWSLLAARKLHRLWAQFPPIF